MRAGGTALLLALWLAGRALALAEATSPVPPDQESRRATILTTVEGTVLALDETAAEGAVPVVVARIEAAGAERVVLLAPRSVLEEAGFELEIGDRLRARVFAEAGGERVFSQKIMNLTRRRLLRLRTLRHEPLWDLAGRWQSRGEKVGPVRHRVRRRPPARRHRPPQRPRPPRLSPRG